MENIEFISAKDLPVTEANEVDVLCVENGELKRKAGASLGGGGYVFKLKQEDTTFNEEMGWREITTDCTELVNAIGEGKFVQISIPSTVAGYDEGYSTISPVMELYVSDGILSLDTWGVNFYLPNTPIPSFLLEG